jgi:hypothetical protein
LSTPPARVGGGVCEPDDEEASIGVERRPGEPAEALLVAVCTGGARNKEDVVGVGVAPEAAPCGVPDVGLEAEAAVVGTEVEDEVGEVGFMLSCVLARSLFALRVGRCYERCLCAGSQCVVCRSSKWHVGLGRRSSSSTIYQSIRFFLDYIEALSFFFASLEVCTSKSSGLNSDSMRAWEGTIEKGSETRLPYTRDFLIIYLCPGLPREKGIWRGVHTSSLSFAATFNQRSTMRVER